MSHIIKKSCLTYLQKMIEHFLKIYVDEFGSQSLTCKFHYMVHYPSQILKYGPLKKIWNMRFEMKHQYLKVIIKGII